MSWELFLFIFYLASKVPFCRTKQDEMVNSKEDSESELEFLKSKFKTLQFDNQLQSRSMTNRLR